MALHAYLRSAWSDLKANFGAVAEVPKPAPSEAPIGRSGGAGTGEAHPGDSITDSSVAAGGETAADQSRNSSEAAAFVRLASSLSLSVLTVLRHRCPDERSAYVLNAPLPR
jgi:hypothetical protein